MHRREPKCVSVVEQQVAELGLADTHRILKHGLEHWLQFTRRAADHLEHIGGGGLLLQRFAQLVKQPRVFDGDDSLVGEILDHFDLLVGEWPHLLAVEIAPIGSSSLSIGTAMYDRAPPSLAAGFKAFSAVKSAIWIACFAWIACQRPPVGLG
jgi:hypothetical protein